MVSEIIFVFNRKDRLKVKLDNIQSQINQGKMNLDTSETLLANASNLLEESIGKLKQLQEEPENLETRNSEFKARCVYQVSFNGVFLSI